MAPTSPKKRKESVADISQRTPAKRLKGCHPSDTQFCVVKTSLVLSVPPVFSANPRAGVEELLDSMIMRYNSSLQGVVLSHSNLTFINKVAIIQGDCPFLVCTVGFDATVWSPRVGFTLSGRVNLCSPDHISLLVLKTFNVSIPRHHIPTDTWEFEYGPAENDPEFGQTVQREEEDGKGQEADHHTGGRWVHRVTGEVLGGDGGLLEFTVIGLTVANEMLSLVGSLQFDPFSPRHVVHGPAEKEQSSSSEGELDVNSESESESSQAG